jgi:hypothetical protein
MREISSVFSVSGQILICSTCSASSDVKSACSSGGSVPPPVTGVGGASAVRIAVRVRTGVS